MSIQAHLEKDQVISQSDVSIYTYPATNKGILLIEAKKSINPIGWAQHNKSLIEQTLLKHGGLLLRGFDIHSSFRI